MKQSMEAGYPSVSGSPPEPHTLANAAATVAAAWRPGHPETNLAGSVKGFLLGSPKPLLNSNYGFLTPAPEFGWAHPRAASDIPGCVTCWFFLTRPSDWLLSTKRCFLDVCVFRVKPM